MPESQITNLANMKGSITFAGKNGIGSTPATLKKKNIGPRFGFAYQWNDKLVMRGGFATVLQRSEQRHLPDGRLQHEHQHH